MKRKKNTRHAVIIACCCLLAVTVVAVIASYGSSVRQEESDACLPVRSGNIEESSWKLNESDADTVSGFYDPYGYDLDVDSIPSYAWESVPDLDGSAVEEDEFLDEFELFLFHCLEVFCLSALAVLFTGVILFLVMWLFVTRYARKADDLKTVDTCNADTYVTNDQLKDLVFKDFSEKLKDVYGYRGSQGSFEFLLWVYFRIKDSDDVAPRFIPEALLQLRSGRIRTLYDYDWYVQYYRKLRVTSEETSDFIGRVMANEHSDSCAGGSERKVRKAGKKVCKEVVKAESSLVGDPLHDLTGSIDPFEESCM